MVGELSLDTQSRRSLRTIESRSVDGTRTSTVTSSNMVRMKGLVKGTPSRFEGSHRVPVDGVVVELPSATGPETGRRRTRDPRKPTTVRFEDITRGHDRARKWRGYDGTSSLRYQSFPYRRCARAGRRVGSRSGISVMRC